MAIPTKFQNFVADKDAGLINFNTDVFKLFLTNTLPIATQHHVADIVAELANGNGYTTGGLTLAVSKAYSAGVLTVTMLPVTLTASGGSVGPFRYYAIRDVTADSLMVWYDLGASVTLTSGQSYSFSIAGNVLLVDV